MHNDCVHFVDVFFLQSTPRAPYQGAADEGGWGLYRHATFPIERYNIKPATTPTASRSPLKGGTRVALTGILHSFSEGKYHNYALCIVHSAFPHAPRNNADEAFTPSVLLICNYFPLYALAAFSTPCSSTSRAASAALAMAGARSFSSCAENLLSTQSARSYSGWGFPPTPTFTRGN